MCDRNPSPASSSSSTAVGRCHGRHSMEDDEGGEAETCTGKSCQSCTAGVIADCVAVCCCPCAVVNILTLALVKLPWSVGRKCIGRWKMKRRRRLLEERWRDGIMELSGRGAGEVTSEIGGEQLNEHLSGGEEVWLELYELGQLGFGRVSFTGIPFHHKAD